MRRRRSRFLRIVFLLATLGAIGYLATRRSMKPPAGAGARAGGPSPAGPIATREPAITEVGDVEAPGEPEVDTALAAAAGPSDVDVEAKAGGGADGPQPVEQPVARKAAPKKAAAKKTAAKKTAAKKTAAKKATPEKSTAKEAAAKKAARPAGTAETAPARDHEAADQSPPAAPPIS